MTKPIRLNRYLAQLGVTSRRKADDLISEGRVSIQGKVINELGFQVLPGTKGIEIDGAPLERSKSKLVYYLLNKPRSVVTTLSDPQGRPTVVDFLPSVKERVFPVGRLDYDAEGVLILTNDGDLAHQLTHPKFGAKKTYLVKVKGRPTQESLAKLRKGFRLDDGFAKPIDLTFDRATKTNSFYRMTVAEGRNHLVKRMWMRVNHLVSRLTRVDFAGIPLGTLAPGRVRPLRKGEIERLKRSMKG